jgi:large subunit ribosomal protein L25
METLDISANLRSVKGTGGSRRLRREGRVPGTFYGPARSAISIEVDAKEFSGKVAHLEGSHLVRLASEAPELSGRVALVRELQWHPVTGALLHTDLYEVDLDRKLTIKVPLHFVGKAIGVTQQSGILQPILREVQVECLPTDIPDFFEVDVSHLGIHDAVHIADIQTPEGVTLVFESNDAVVSVLPPAVEQVKAEGEAEGEAAAAAPAEAAKAPAAPTKG